MKMDYFKILLIFLIALPAQVFADISSGDGGYISQGVPNSEITLTAEEWAFLNSHDLRCAMAPNWSPINMYDQSKQLVGIAIDYWKLISKQLNINVDCAVKESYSEVLQAIETRDTDFMLATSMTDDRKHYAEFSKAYVSFPIAIATTVDTDYMADESALFGKRVAVGQGYSAYHILTKDNPGIEFVEVDNTRVGLQMLAANKVFAVVDNLPVLQQLIKEVKHNNIKVAGTTRHNIELRLMVRSDYPQLTVIFNKAIDMISEQEHKRILSRWLDPSEINDQSIVFTPAEQAWLAQDHTVRVRTFDWPPYMMTGGSDPLEGIAVEYLKLIEKRSGIKFSYEKSSTSFAEFLANMKRRQGPDMTSLIVSSPDREEYFSFTESYVSSPYVIFAQVKDDLILDINGLAGKVVAVPESFIIQTKLTRDYPEIKLALFDSDEQCLYAVATGKADAYIGNLTVASHIIQKKGLTSVQVVAASPYGEEDLSMGVRKDWPELASIIDKALASITEKEKTEILKNYVSVQYNQGLEKARVLKWVLIFLAVVFAVISLFIVWNRSLSRRVRERTEQLSESEQRYRALFEQNQVGIIFADAQTRRFKYANLAVARMLGYTQEELCALGVEDIHPPEAQDLARREFEAQYKGEKGMIRALPCLRKDGSVIYADVSAQSIITSEGKFSIGFFTDITDRKQAQQAHKISEQRFRAIMEQAPFSIVVNSPDGRMIQVNQAFMDLWGISEQALPQVLEAYNILHDDEARKRGIMPLIERAFRGEAVSLPEIEYDVTSTMREIDIEGDESGKRWVQVHLYPIKGDRDELLNVVVVEEDITERKQAEEMLQVYQERLRVLAATLTRTEVQERSKIATELHDHVGQSLAVMRIQLAAARKEGGDRKVGVILDDVSESLREAIQDTRSIMSDLSSPALYELGLSVAIADWLKEKIEDRHGLQTCFEDDGEPKPLSDDASAIAFRSVRELLMNIIKHASASRVTVSVRKEGQMLKIIVEDDGVGMPASTEREHKSDVRGFGLFSIMERMNDLDGSLSIESHPGQGVRAILSIPLEDAS